MELVDLDHELTIQLLHRSQDLREANVLDFEGWEQPDIDGKFLSRLTDKLIKEKFKKTKPYQRETLLAFVKNNSPRVKIKMLATELIRGLINKTSKGDKYCSEMMNMIEQVLKKENISQKLILDKLHEAKPLIGNEKKF